MTAAWAEPGAKPNDSFRRALRARVLLYDGAKGSILAQKGLQPGEFPDACNLTRPGDVLSIHEDYANAGADAIQTNTLQASGFHLEAHGLAGRLEEINRAGVRLALEAARGCEARTGRRVFVAGSVGPSGKMLEPAGGLTFDSALAAYSEQVRVLLDAGVDALHFETFTDLAELRVAILAARYCCGAPIVATMSFGRGGATVMGDRAEAAADVLAGLGADCVGANCGLGPEGMLSALGRMAGAGVPLCAKPNAGQPDYAGGAALYGSSAQSFRDAAFGFARLGARLVGGCCGCGPEHVAAMREAVDAVNGGEGGGGSMAAEESSWAGGGGPARPDGARPDGARPGRERPDSARRDGLGAVATACDFRDLDGAPPEDAEPEIIERLVDSTSGNGGGGGICLALLPPGKGIARAVAGLSRLYAKTRMGFGVGGAGERDGLATILAALERYCGRALAVVPAHWSDASREAIGFYGATVVDEK